MGKRLDPDAAAAVMRAAKLEPLEPYPGAMPRWKCRCMRCGATVTPTYSGVAAGQGGCKYCGSRRSGRAQRRDSEEAAATMRDAGLEPLVPYPGRNKAPWRCRCMTCGSEVSPTYNSVQQGQGCRACGIKRRAASHSMPADQAVATMLAAGVEPLEPYSGNGKLPWRAECVRCGREVAPRLHDLLTKQSGACKWCGKVQGGLKKRVPPERAEAVLRAAGAEPLEPYPGALTPWKSRCTTCKRIVRPRYAGLTQGRGACRFCADSSIDWDAPGVLYLVRSAEGYLKVGISSNWKQRSLEHRLQGFAEVVTLLEVRKMREAASAEDRVLKYLRQLGVTPPIPRSAMPYGGHTETFDPRDLPEPFDLARFLKPARPRGRSRSVPV